MKKVKWFVVALLVVFSVIFLVSASHALTTEEQQYVLAMANNATNVNNCLMDVSNTLSNASVDNFNDPSWLVGLIIKVANLGKVAGEAEAIPCPERFRESNFYYLLCMDSLQSFSDYFIKAIKTNDKELMKIAFDYLLKGQEYMNEFNVAWAKETKDVN